MTGPAQQPSDAKHLALVRTARNDQAVTRAIDLAAQVVMHRNALIHGGYAKADADQMAKLFHAHLLNSHFEPGGECRMFPVGMIE